MPEPFDAGLPTDFLWGAATAAYQIEGSPLADGAGASIWHRFAHTPGRMANGDTGDVACDHYNRWREDVALMRQLGLQAYRFSLAWGRLLPEGVGRVNAAGVDHYSRLIDALIENGIEPCVTLYHWDLPAALDDRGGWLNDDVAEWFAEYAALAFRAYGDRVKMWMTINEPWVVVDGGYMHGTLAPGHRSAFAAMRASRNVLRAHVAAVRAYRAERRDRIGLVVNLEPKVPVSESPADVAATARADAYMNRQFLDPVFRGRYPDEMYAMFAEEIDASFTLPVEPVDFLGVNYYTRGVTRDDPSEWPVRASTVRVPTRAYTETGWEVYPQGLCETLCWVRERYGNVPLYVTENGAAFPDPPSVTVDELEDPLRVEHVRSHLASLRAARERGVDVRGYFAWSLLDNLEWSHGYSKRFGIVHVDYATQKRTIKRSGLEYAKMIAAARSGAER